MEHREVMAMTVLMGQMVRLDLLGLRVHQGLLDRLAQQDQKGQRVPQVRLVLKARPVHPAHLGHNEEFMKAWWQLFNKALCPTDCEELKAYALAKPAQTAVIGHGGKAVQDNMRRSTVRWLDRADPILGDLYSLISARLCEANRRVFGVDYHDFNEVQFTEYLASNAGHYDWHEDNTWKIGPDAPIWDRKLSVVIQLSASTSYEGGRLELDRDALPETAFVNQGDLIVFPSILKHRVIPVTKGVRHSLVTWAVGPRWK